MRDTCKKTPAGLASYWANSVSDLVLGSAAANESMVCKQFVWRTVALGFFLPSFVIQSVSFGWNVLSRNLSVRHSGLRTQAFASGLLAYVHTYFARSLARYFLALLIA